MSIHSGTLSVLEIGKIYNVGFSYSQNIVNELERIGYIKKRTDAEYSMIQTEQSIDAYIKEHFEEFRPDYYDSLELKNNGKPTLRSKAKKAWKATPMFMCRVFISPFSVILTLFAILNGSFTLFVIGIICNIVYVKYVSQNEGVKFTEFMLRPWLWDRVRTVSEIRNIMRKSNIKNTFRRKKEISRTLCGYSQQRRKRK